jgi:hypothetical protein
MARPRKNIDPVQVEKMAAVGCTPEEIAILLDASPRTIDQRFYKPYEKGRRKLQHTLKRVLFREALSGNTAALIFAAKVYCGLREPRDDDVVALQNNLMITVSLTEARQVESRAQPVRESVKKMFAEYRPSGNGGSLK